MRALSISGIYETGGALRLRRGLLGEVTDADMVRANMPIDRVITMMTFDGQDRLLARALLPASSLCSLPKSPPAPTAPEKFLIGGLVSIPEDAHIIRFYWEGAQVHEVARPRSAPQVQFTWTPSAGLLRGRQRVTWHALHPDSAPISYFLFLDRGSEASRPVFMGDASMADIDFAQLPGGANMRLRILATDGFHNTKALSQYFSVASPPVSVVVMQPAAATVLASGQPVQFEGMAWSADAGLVADDKLRWSSDKDGDLGFGHTIRATLSRGNHVVSLQVVGVSATGAVASSSTSLTVR